MWRPIILMFLKYFCQNANTFYTKHFCLPIFIPTYYFSCVILACILCFPKISVFTFLIHLELINYFSCVTLACILFFSKFSLFNFLIHLELINYFSCVTLECILLFLQIDASACTSMRSWVRPSRQYGRWWCFLDPQISRTIGQWGL